MPIVSCYSMDLYCDNAKTTCQNTVVFPVQFTGYDRAECYRKARKAGWILRDNPNKAICPKCSRKKEIKKETKGKTVTVFDALAQLEGKGEK